MKKIEANHGSRRRRGSREGDNSSARAPAGASPTRRRMRYLLQASFFYARVLSENLLACSLPPPCVDGIYKPLYRGHILTIYFAFWVYHLVFIYKKNLSPLSQLVLTNSEITRLLICSSFAICWYCVIFLTHLADSHLLPRRSNILRSNHEEAKKWRAILLDRRGWIANVAPRSPIISSSTLMQWPLHRCKSCPK